MAVVEVVRPHFWIAPKESDMQSGGLSGVAMKVPAKGQSVLMMMMMAAKH